jgi:hypothetical protein
MNYYESIVIIRLKLAKKTFEIFSILNIFPPVLRAALTISFPPLNFSTNSLYFGLIRLGVIFLICKISSCSLIPLVFGRLCSTIEKKSAFFSNIT